MVLSLVSHRRSFVAVHGRRGVVWGSLALPPKQQREGGMRQRREGENSEGGDDRVEKDDLINKVPVAWFELQFKILFVFPAGRRRMINDRILQCMDVHLERAV